ncbi:MarR family winged helix-turn-helix transcriptional regulator [Rhodococcus sp. H29-C3]|uniref:MarR family winged helix-turn-helix transcriptional regulator n=1 Tax=Rhodococcus sp. H29-C3 TaxID=3046307 RepID=UPI0024B97467|nr:MarR family winged helix-turn-helix transcriptional regulator [Rhodococcus sp. H29-C3]MDJ0363417.1 MarR family winged helix-turn-helix transcriptional regulator [Rhodococcus sp. H29-C3]
MDYEPPNRLLETPSWLMTQTAVVAARASREVFDEMGAGRYHYAILCALDEYGPCSQADVGKHLHMDRKDVANRIAELEQLGGAARNADPDDPRRNLVRITAAGRQQMIEIHARLSIAQDELLQDLTPGERKMFVHLLQVVLGRRSGPADTKI